MTSLTVIFPAAAVLTTLQDAGNLQEKYGFALYMSDVSGAFDRVSAERLLAKLRARKVPDDLFKAFTSWLRKRWAEVVVGGQRSLKYCLTGHVREKG